MERMTRTGGPAGINKGKKKKRKKRGKKKGVREGEKSLLTSFTVWCQGASWLCASGLFTGAHSD